MKIAIISSVHRWDDTRIFFRQASSLARRHDVELHAPAPFQYKVVNNVKVFGLHKWEKEVDRIKLWIILFYRMLKSNASVVHFHDPELIPLAFFLKIITGKKIIYDVHEHILNDIEDKEWIPPLLRGMVSSIFKLVERICVPIFDTVVYTTRIVGKRYQSLAKQAVSIENYPKISMFKNKVSSDNQILKNDIIYLGRVFYVRGVEEVIRSWPAVIEKYPDARFLIVGDIVPESYENQLKQIAKDLNLESHIIFCGFVKYDAVGEYLNKALAGIVTFLPYKNNMSCLPNKLFEYMASSIPVIASDFPLYREIVESSQCGTLINPTDTTQLSEAVVNLLQNKDTALKMGQSGRKSFLEKFCWEKEEHKLFQIYENFEI
jgi:glycosyltransferase involved in cell wall biosynthesis